ncbi:MAG TPA: hypothetical protein VFW50_18570 [Streptosporangiaceae bacterium]|nr:hypothetical protein [Streptosporangiaceae bacterium]
MRGVPARDRPHDPSVGREDGAPVTLAASQQGPQRQADRLEELLARGAAAVRRIAADYEDDKGRAQYAARIGREA